eukprot:TRINITY_DN4236_c0_g1_i1.p1 TRINITY_DN4236_c0_g1~~TRINITY_DN4236_c0_g1_i1.p1  ORF type:complete len:464 (+),score=52.79 TRINITY_DN4236_c0_g1_i1:62-1393(+)
MNAVALKVEEKATTRCPKSHLIHKTPKPLKKAATTKNPVVASFERIQRPEDFQDLKASWGGSWGHDILKAWKINNKKLEQRFNETQAWLSHMKGEYLDISHGYHGTTEMNIDGITNNGFDTLQRNAQAHGKGEYFSAKPKSAVPYCGEYMLYCKLLIGTPGVHSTYVPDQRFHIVHTKRNTVMALPMLLIKFRDMGESHKASIPAWLASLDSVTSAMINEEDLPPAKLRFHEAHPRHFSAVSKALQSMPRNGTFHEMLIQLKKDLKASDVTISRIEWTYERLVRYYGLRATGEVEERHLYLNTFLPASELALFLECKRNISDLSFSSTPETIYGNNRKRFVILCSVITVGDGEQRGPYCVRPLYAIFFRPRVTRGKRARAVKAPHIGDAVVPSQCVQEDSLLLSCRRFMQQVFLACEMYIVVVVFFLYGVLLACVALGHGWSR